MLFNSLVFLFLFLPVAYVVFWSLRTTAQRHIWLTITGYVFYGYWDPRFCLLMAFSTLVSYGAGLGFLRWGENPRSRKLLLIIPITADLLLLGFFKYEAFAAQTINSIATAAGYGAIAPVLNVVLPVGISFYTFHTISYIVDCYRGTVKPTRSVFEFSAYVSLFSQLVAGPIVRFRQIEKDLENLATANRLSGLYVGISFFVFGLAEKVLVADTLAAYVDPWLLDYRNLSSAMAWLVMVAYTMQLYFDFCGYSSMAVGLGLMFGLNIPQNFNSPYRALNPADFWRRWHISLSTCIRDYIFIPLGGSRGTAAKTARNLMLAMLIGGLWHGANMTFVVWGAYHGLLLVIYRATSRHWDRLPDAASMALTFVLVIGGWVLFRATDMQMASAILGKMFSLDAGLAPSGWESLLLATAAATVWSIAGPNVFEFHQRRPGVRAPGAVIGIVFGLCLAVIVGSRASPFLYFQF